MLPLFSVSSLLLASLAAAQTPPGFAPAVKDRLDLIVGTKVITVPGTSLTKAETAKQPGIGTSDVALTGASYLWMMIGEYLYLSPYLPSLQFPLLSNSQLTT